MTKRFTAEVVEAIVKVAVEQGGLPRKQGRLIQRELVRSLCKANQDDLHFGLLDLYDGNRMGRKWIGLMALERQNKVAAKVFWKGLDPATRKSLLDLQRRKARITQLATQQILSRSYLAALVLSMEYGEMLSPSEGEIAGAFERAKPLWTKEELARATKFFKT